MGRTSSQPDPARSSTSSFRSATSCDSQNPAALKSGCGAIKWAGNSAPKRLMVLVIADVPLLCMPATSSPIRSFTLRGRRFAADRLEGIQTTPLSARKVRLQARYAPDGRLPTFGAPSRPDHMRLRQLWNPFTQNPFRLHYCHPARRSPRMHSHWIATTHDESPTNPA